MATKLDSLDYKILKMLSLNARKPYLEIARACNVSGAAIHQRIQKLYNMGVIKGSISLINPASVGYQTCAYIGFFLNDPSKFDEVVARLKTVPEVVECYFTRASMTCSSSSMPRTTTICCRSSTTAS